jgi:hypothetical protein
MTGLGAGPGGFDEYGRPIDEYGSPLPDPRDVNDPNYDPALDPDLAGAYADPEPSSMDDYVPAPDGYEYVKDAQGTPRSDRDGDLYLRSTESGEHILWDPSDGQVYTSDIDFDAIAAGAARQILEDNPNAMRILAEAEGVAHELENQPSFKEPDPDVSYDPPQNRERSLGESFDQGIDEILGGDTT